MKVRSAEVIAPIAGVSGSKMLFVERDYPPGNSQESIDLSISQIDDQSAAGTTVNIHDTGNTFTLVDNVLQACINLANVLTGFFSANRWAAGHLTRDADAKYIHPSVGMGAVPTIDASYCFFSLVFVVCLSMDKPADWHHIFGNVLKAYSIRRF
ncbi:hypothetical protein B0A50_05266 [Salinomyces thailandicus]|uniref:Uncharacterized protein n=1 Tax=Salinomyces thailandicus TaxID=706561 RepID=A0A4U0TVQ1_9PEZI|nr:hypothetical protein B0A50_05266 [Salinomyces thailandica]